MDFELENTPQDDELNLEELKSLLEDTNNTPTQEAPAGEVPVAEAPAPEQKKPDPKKEAVLYLKDLVGLLSIIVVIFLVLFRIVIVSGDSMYNTLNNDDYLLLLSSTVYRQPQQGDIIVASKASFRHGEPIVKRIIATEGQTVDIDFAQGIVYVDGVALKEDYTYTATTDDEGTSFPVVVEEGCVFVMGDNRGVSKDSRNPEIGQIDTREILGKVIFLLVPGEDRLTGERDFDRIGGIS